MPTRDSLNVKIVKPNPINAEGFTDLDMRVSTATGKDLMDEIFASVAATQNFILTTLPDRLIVTQQQFKSLEHNTMELDHTEDRLFVTPQNAMYVVIDRDYNTDEQIEATMQLTDELKAASDEPKAEAKKPTDQPKP